MKIIFRSLFVSFLLCYACQNSTTEKDGLKTIYADITQWTKDRPVDSYADSVEFIPLETTDSSLIRAINQMIVKDERIYIVDQTQSAVLVFNNDGKFLFKLDKLGRGPDEYNGIQVVRVDEQYIYVLGMSELLLYDKYNGEFVRKHFIHPQDFFPIDLFVNSTSYYFLTAKGFPNQNIQATIAVFDKKDFQLQKCYMDPYYFMPRDYAPGKVFIESPYGILFHQKLNDTVYRLGEERLEPLFYINSGKYQLTQEAYEQLPMDENNQFRKVPYKAIFINNIAFFDKYLYFQCTQDFGENENLGVYFCYYSLENQQMTIFNNDDRNPQNKYHTDIFYFETCDDSGYCYSICYPFVITYARETKKETLIKELENIKAEDNPWVMKFRFKI